MKLRKMGSFIILLLAGCVSQIASIDTYRNGWLGRPLSDLRKTILRSTSHASSIGWKETMYELENGNLIYVTPDRKDCFIHWEVDSQGIIVNSKLKGMECY